MEYLKALYNFLVVGKEKAVVAFLVTAVGTYLAKHGWNVDNVTLTNVVSALVYGVVAHLAVYVTTNTPN